MTTTRPIRSAFAAAALAAATCLAATLVGCHDGDAPPAGRDDAAWRDVASYVGQACAPCHRDGGPAPFSLTTAGDLRRRSRAITNAVRSGYMPPWLPGRAGVSLQGDRHPTAERAAALVAWLAAETTIDPGAAIDPPTIVEPAADLVVAPPGPIPVPAAEDARVVTLDLPLPLDAPTWVRGAALVSADAERMGHALIRVVRGGAGSSRSRGDDAIIHLSPATGPWRAPDGLAWPLAPGDRLRIRVYVMPGPRAVELRPSLALELAESPPRRTAIGSILETGDIVVPPRERRFEVERGLDLARDATLIEILPDAHLLCRSLTLEAVRPDGAATTVLDVPSWDLAWQEAYRPAEPLRLPAGTRVVARWTFDNSLDNARNPHDPLIPVASGPLLTDARGRIALTLVEE